MNSGGPAARRRRLLAVNLLLLVGAALFCADLYLARKNSLLETGLWESTKHHLSHRPMGSVAFFLTRVTVGGNQLNLSRYFHFNEVRYREALDDLAYLAFSFKAEGTPGCLLAVSFRRNKDGSSGLMLCGGDYPRESFFYDADPLGRFIRRVPLRHERFYFSDEGRVELSFKGGSVEARINGQVAGSYTPPTSRGHVIAFRTTGHRPPNGVVVDHVSLERPDGTEWAASFANRGALLPVAGVALVAGVVLNLLLWLPWRRRSGVLVRALLFNGAALVCVVTLHQVDTRHFAHQYPDRGDINWRGLEIAEETEEQITSRVMAKYEKAQPPAGAARVLFLGTSQTWGEGASTPARVTSRVVERALNQGGTPAQIINAGVRASDSGKLLAAYREALIKLKPDLLVVILAFNDQDGQALARNLEALVKLNRAAGIRTLLVAEPCNCDWGYVRENQAMMPALARRLEVPLVQPQASLDKQVDHAFLWWDLVHLSDAGQAALAQELLKGGVEGGVERAVAEIVRLKGAAAPPEAPR